MAGLRAAVRYRARDGFPDRAPQAARRAAFRTPRSAPAALSAPAVSSSARSITTQ
jgi:hypothetical protein